MAVPPYAQAAASQLEQNQRAQRDEGGELEAYQPVDAFFQAVEAGAQLTFQAVQAGAQLLKGFR